MTMSCSVPRCPPRGDGGPIDGEAAEENEPQRHREHKTHRENQDLQGCRFMLISPDFSVLSALSAPLWFVSLRQQSLADFAVVDDLDRPVARGHQLLVAV